MPTIEQMRAEITQWMREAVPPYPDWYIQNYFNVNDDPDIEIAYLWGVRNDELEKRIQDY